MTVWQQRFEKLQALGVTYRQALAVWALLDESKAFGTERVAVSARRALDRAYGVAS